MWSGDHDGPGEARALAERYLDVPGAWGHVHDLNAAHLS
jgi:hypothetical protein